MCCQSSNSGLMSERMDGSKGEILKDQLDLFGIFLQHLLEQRLEPRTVRSLIVAENSDGNRRFLGTLKWKPGGIKLIHFFELNYLYRIACTVGNHEGILFLDTDHSIEALLNGNAIDNFFHR